MIDEYSSHCTRYLTIQEQPNIVQPVTSNSSNLPIFDCFIGNLGFDPLGLTPKTPAEFDVMRTKEVNNGRLAMIGIAGIVAQELVTSQKVFNF
jgi:hypothetical protein